MFDIQPLWERFKNRMASRVVVGLLCVLLLLVTSVSMWANGGGLSTQLWLTSFTPGRCLSSEESELARKINQYRNANGLNAVPISKSLTEVAQRHVYDLDQYQPDRGRDYRGMQCNQHSWSGKISPNALCYTWDHANAAGMWNKAREITNYQYLGNSFEIAYETSRQANAPEGFRVLLSAYDDIILNKSFWANYDWPAMGVGLYGHHAVVWFGDVEDPQGGIVECPKSGLLSNFTK